jgi:hypothetical protein
MATVLAMGLLLHPKRRGLGAALLLLTLVPVAANRKIGRTFREEEVFSPSPLARMLSRLDPSGSYRVLGESPYRPASALERQYAGADPAYLDFTRRSWFEYAHVLWGRGTIFNADFDSGDLSRTESLRRLSKPLGFFGNGSFFGGLGLRWGVRYRDQQPVSGYYSFGGDGLRYWDGHERPFPDIRLVEAFREETGGIAALQALPRLEPGEVVIETGSARTGKVRPGRLRVLERSPERLLLEAQATDPTWLFAVRGYWPFRTVLLDGRLVEVSPAQIAFSALPVPPGRHTVEWKEELPGLGLSRWGPALFALSALLLWRRQRRRKTGRA